MQLPMATGRKYAVSTEAEYEELKARVERGASFLEGKWGNPDFVREQAHYQEMAMSLYNWDLEHGLIEKGIQEMVARERPRPLRNI